MKSPLRHLLTALLPIISISSYGSIDFDSLNDAAFAYLYSNPDSAFILAGEAYKIAEKDNSKWQMGMAINTQGYSFYMKGDYAKALEYFNESLMLKEEIKDKEGIAIAHVGIGNVYYMQQDFKKSLDHFDRAVKGFRELKDEKNIAMVYINIGGVKYELGNYYSALVFFNKALKVYKKLGNRLGILNCKNNIGAVYHEYKDYDRALENYNSSLELCEEIGDIEGMSNTYINIGDIQSIVGERDKAIISLSKGLKIAKESGFPFREQEAYNSLSNFYADDNDHKQALAYYKLYTSVKDSLFNEGKSKEIGKLEASHEFEMGQMKHRREQQEIQQQQASAKARSDNLQYSGILIFLVTVFASVFMLGKFSIPIRLAEGMIFFAFLLFFEFMLVVLDPYIESYSGGAPAYKLLFNAGIAALIFPLHSLFEAKMKKRLL